MQSGDFSEIAARIGREDAGSSALRSEYFSPRTAPRFYRHSLFHVCFNRSDTKTMPKANNEEANLMSTQHIWETRQLPRQVRLRRSARWFFVPGLLMGAAIIALVVGLPMLFMADTLTTLERLSANGKFVTAEEVKLTNDRGNVDAEYVFTVAGRQYSIHKNCGKDQFPPLMVRVLYWVSDPTVNLIRDKPITLEEIRDARRWYFEGPKFAIAIFVGFVILIALPFAIIPGQIAISRQLDLAQNGVAAEAVITRLVRDSSGRCTVHYEFPAGSVTRQGDCLVVPRILKHTDLHAGQRVTVLYDPQRPRRNILAAALDAVESVGTWTELADSMGLR
jgi:hypothetical protein